MTSDEIQNTTGWVFNIQKYSVHDGPGIRTVVFLKGCPLSCQWCSNPESQTFTPQLAYARTKCITLSECSHCAEVCTAGAITRGEDDKVDIDWQRCNHCLACTDVCPSSALSPYGEKMKVMDVIDQVESDASFYTRSGGGLTLSGGEPLAQPEFAIALLREAKHRYLKTAIETAGLVKREVFLEAAKYLNYILMDIKCIDPVKHKKFTGVDNTLILENFKALRDAFPKMQIRVRTPVVPGFNDTEEDIQAIVDFLKGHDVDYEPLAYHRLGQQKYTNTGREYLLGDVSLPQETFAALQQVAGQHPRAIIK